MSHESLFFLSAASTASGEEEGPDLLRSKFSLSVCAFKRTLEKEGYAGKVWYKVLCYSIKVANTMKTELFCNKMLKN